MPTQEFIKGIAKEFLNEATEREEWTANIPHEAYREFLEALKEEIDSRLLELYGQNSG